MKQTNLPNIANAKTQRSFIGLAFVFLISALLSVTVFGAYGADTPSAVITPSAQMPDTSTPVPAEQMPDTTTMAQPTPEQVTPTAATTQSNTATTSGSDTMQPTIVDLSTMNNEKAVDTHNPITVQFSEAMNPSTINGDTFSISHRTTPATGSSAESYRSVPVAGTVSYNGVVATFTPTYPLHPSQEFGNVYTATVTTGAQDVAGNSLARNYVWSFTTGTDPFNTGDSTSQADQSASVTTAPPITTTPEVAPPVTTSPPVVAPTTSTFPWIWVIGALIVIAVVGLSYAMISQSTPRKKVTTTTLVKSKSGSSNVSPGKASSPFGDVHAVSEIEGIGQVYGERLASIGIMDTHQLWSADSATIASQIEAPVATVQSWQHMAELSAVQSIGPQYAELLERSGIHTIALLRKSTPDKLLALVQRKQDSLKVKIQGSALGRMTVANWIDQARAHRNTT